jgi:hypothetical protein
MLEVAIRSYDWLQYVRMRIYGWRSFLLSEATPTYRSSHVTNGHVRLEQWGVEYEAKEKMAVME